MAIDERDDPLVKALPPETDYLTYLTILEYQLTPEHLPILHNLLQDEKLTTNIGWDLVQLLLPMVPASQECLQDVARLGNPREVILRVSNSLMKLEPVDEDGDNEGDYEKGLSEAVGGVRLEENANAKDDIVIHDQTTATPKVPLHILQFNCLVSMLAVLHSRIQTKYPSRFVATSLQAVLEAYTTFPTVETTAAVLEFFRDTAGKKRPRLPPRNMSESLVPQVTKESAPDPEAESHLGTAASEEWAVIQRLMQFGLVELLKTYLLHCIDEPPAGMRWALRLQEKLDANNRIPASLSFTEDFGKLESLKERDMAVGKIIALSRDFGIETKELLEIISKPNDQQLPPLDFEETPKRAEDIPLQRHGCLLLLAARCAADKLLSSGQPVEPIPVFPDLAVIFSNFLGEGESSYSTVISEPEALVDSLLSLAVIASCEPVAPPHNQTELGQFMLQLTACIRAPSFRSFSRMARIPSQIFHSNPDSLSRFNLVCRILDDDNLEYSRETAMGWVKEELIAATAPSPPDQKEKRECIFTDPKSFANLFPKIYKPIPDGWLTLRTAKTEDLINIWMTFTQHSLPFHLSILNLLYFLTQSQALLEHLQMKKLYPYFRSKFLEPLQAFMQSILTDAEITARVEMEVGDEAVQVGKGAADLVLHIIGEIEEGLAGVLGEYGGLEKENLDPSTTINHSFLKHSTVKSNKRSVTETYGSNNEESDCSADSGGCTISQSHLSNSTISSSHIYCCNVKSCTLSNAGYLSDTHLRNSTLSGTVRVIQCKVKASQFIYALGDDYIPDSITETEGPAIQKSDIRNSIIGPSPCTISRARLRKVKISCSTVADACLDDCDVADCMISKGRFSGLWLRNGIWEGGELVGKMKEGEDVVIKARGFAEIEEKEREREQERFGKLKEQGETGQMIGVGIGDAAVRGAQGEFSVESNSSKNIPFREDSTSTNQPQEPIQVNYAFPIPGPAESLEQLNQSQQPLAAASKEQPYISICEGTPSPPSTVGYSTSTESLVEVDEDHEFPLHSPDDGMVGIGDEKLPPYSP
ncbi:hypothetical protein PAAG_12246 [Paracoccidioides lutzii Pb01]|uniref:Uncharacterized protein n=1 Tax=Paracoccidioides lutzii (strain ATCC MYA-826 / Pb01) TaxID=502779 RepID=A0A0A2V0M4_PARBA|nr:hypothetical protein PAAG_12246 [Paracoccidioides lutzii Pb01]KGQ01053.1 hypothetical protein PAAG_12246 [Paracoccidioides lutzii Pb01]